MSKAQIEAKLKAAAYEAAALYGYAKAIDITVAAELNRELWK